MVLRLVIGSVSMNATSASTTSSNNRKASAQYSCSCMQQCKHILLTLISVESVTVAGRCMNTAGNDDEGDEDEEDEEEDEEEDDEDEEAYDEDESEMAGQTEVSLVTRHDGRCA